MPQAKVDGDGKGSVNFKMANSKGKITDGQWDRYFPCYSKKSHRETEMLSILLCISKGNCSASTLCRNCSEL